MSDDNPYQEPENDSVPPSTGDIPDVRPLEVVIVFVVIIGCSAMLPSAVSGVVVYPAAAGWVIWKILRHRSNRQK